jgi:DNA damage-binding protein 1
MVKIYEERGMSTDDAELIVNLMADHPDFFVDIMMVEELGMQVPDADDSPIKDGLVTFASFVVFGFMPILTYCVLPFAMPHLTQHELFYVACAVTGITLFVLGVVKARFSSTGMVRSGIEMAIFGGAVAAVAYLIARFAGHAVGHHATINAAVRL